LLFRREGEVAVERRKLERSGKETEKEAEAVEEVKDYLEYIP